VVDPLHFDRKIKNSDVPEWDGDDETLLTWLERVNQLASRSRHIYDELGQILPQRLIKKAHEWFYALTDVQQDYTQRNWGTFRLAISTHFMNPHWLEKMKLRTLRMRYRQKSHESETPSDYFHRKLKMIRLLFTLTEPEIIMEIMNGAPRYWTTIIDTSRNITVQDLQDAIRYHEDQLLTNPRQEQNELEKRIKALENTMHSSRTHVAETNFSKFQPKKFSQDKSNFKKYPFPKNDSIVTKVGKTPGQRGRKPCRWCGSLNHWDNEHPLSNEEKQKAKTFLANLEPQELEAFFATEEVSEDELPAIEEEDDPASFSNDEDFPSSPQ